MKHKKLTLSWNLNLNSLVIGFLLAICLLLTIGAVGSNPSPRYQCCTAGNEALAVFVIDTETGNTWRLGRTDMYDFGTPTKPKSRRRSIRPMLD
jgi:hypothetical protein